MALMIAASKALLVVRNNAAFLMPMMMTSSSIIMFHISTWKREISIVHRQIVSHDTQIGQYSGRVV